MKISPQQVRNLWPCFVMLISQFLLYHMSIMTKNESSEIRNLKLFGESRYKQGERLRRGGEEKMETRRKNSVQVEKQLRAIDKV